MSKKGVQYKPYDALKGFQSTLREKEAQKKKIVKPTLDNDRLEELGNILANLDNNNMVEIKYYENGEIIEIVGNIKKIDYVYKKITIESIVISIFDILNIRIL